MSHKLEKLGAKKMQIAKKMAKTDDEDEMKPGKSKDKKKGC